MSVLFSSVTGLQSNNAQLAVTNYPFSVGMWINLTAVGASTRCLFTLEDSGASTNYFAVKMSTTEQLGVYAIAGGSLISASAGTSMTAGRWFYLVARFIDATNRRISVLHSLGLPEHAQSVTSVAPAGIVYSYLGTGLVDSQPWDGLIAEFWLANVDIQPDGAQLQNQMLRQLAYGGPFLPHIEKNIVDYHSFRYRSRRTSGDERIGEVYSGPFGTQRWVGGTIPTGAHPPLPYWYRRPNEPLTSWSRLVRNKEMLLPTPPAPTQFVVQSNLRW